MLPQTQVLVDLEDEVVAGLVLKATSDGASLLVTYEQAGRVVTTWLAAARVSAAEN